jgi:succinoglycan biosynthesis transport protein ExoP
MPDGRFVYAPSVHPEEPQALELRDYLRVLRRRKWIIAVALLLCIGAALTMALIRQPIYSSSARVLLERRLVERLFVPTGESGNTNAPATERGNEIQVMYSPKVFKAVAKKIGRVAEAPSISPVEGTDVVSISVDSSKPKRAAETANAFAETYIKTRRELIVQELLEAGTEIQTKIAALDQQIATVDASLAASPPAPVVKGQDGPTDPRQIDRAGLESQRISQSSQLDSIQTGAAVAAHSGAQILARAHPSSEPVNQDLLQNGLAGVAIGIVLGFALAFLREYLDDTVKTKEDLESASGLTVVGLIPALPDWKNREAAHLVAMAQPRSPAAEAYRSVRTSVEFLGLDQPIGSLQVTSAIAAEGKTTTLANLATTFARAGQRVIILCCDMRRPRIHDFFGLTNRVGFTSVLLGDAQLADAIQPVPGDHPIGMVASGPLPPNPAELLSSKRALGVIEALESRCDLLLIDSPPVLPVTDAQVIAGLVDGVLLVANAGTTAKRGLRRAVELLEQVDAPLIGALLNNVHEKSGYAYAYGKHGYYDTAAPRDQELAAADTKNGGRRARKRTGVSR